MRVPETHALPRLTVRLSGGPVRTACLRVKEARDAAAAGQAALAFARIVSIQPPGEAGGS